VETPLNCSEKCAEMSQLYVLKAFIEKTENEFLISLLYNEFKKLSKKTNSSKNSGNL